MGKSYKRFFNKHHYSYPELVNQIARVKKSYPGTVGGVIRSKVELLLTLKPTESSIEYTVKITARKDSTKVRLFVVNPKIGLIDNEKTVPHMYPDSSLCLYYPEYREWKYDDLWADTLIPWASLWLFFYEIWKETGEWLGGGIHGKKTKE